MMPLCPFGLLILLSVQGGDRRTPPTPEKAIERSRQFQQARSLIFDADVPNESIKNIARGVEIAQRLVSEYPDLESLRLLRQGTLFMANFGPAEGRESWLGRYRQAQVQIGSISKDYSEILDGALVGAKNPLEEASIIEAHLQKYPRMEEAQSLGEALFQAHSARLLSSADLERRVEKAMQALAVTVTDQELAPEWRNLRRLPLMARCDMPLSNDAEIAEHVTLSKGKPTSLAEQARTIRSLIAGFKCKVRVKS